jgi:hypothetical protein
MPWSDGLARLIRAGVAVTRDKREAASLLRAAADKFDGADMPLYAAAARRLLGRLDGVDGQSVVDVADAWMQGQGVQNPTRLTALLAPGFSG